MRVKWVWVMMSATLALILPVPSWPSEASIMRWLSRPMCSSKRPALRQRKPIETWPPPLEAVVLPTNPNDAIVRSLSPEQQEQYADAYWGSSTTDGCYYLTYKEAWGVDIRTLNRVAEDKLVEAERLIAADPRIVVARAEFVDCMNRRGYDFTSVDQINLYEFDQQDEVVEKITGAPPIPGGGVEADHPLWQDYLSRVVEFKEGLAGCEPEYLGVVQPIENEYLGHNR